MRRCPDEAALALALTGRERSRGHAVLHAPDQLPSQATNEELDGRSDIFSFVLPLYGLLTGKCAIESSNRRGNASRANQVILIFGSHMPVAAIPTIDEIRSLVPDFCRAHGIARLEVFGSVARHEARTASDADLLVTFRPDAHPGLDFFSMQDEPQELLGISPSRSRPGDPWKRAITRFAGSQFPNPPWMSMQNRQQAHPLDILKSAEAIHEYVSGYTLEQFLSDARTQDAVLRRPRHR